MSNLHHSVVTKKHLHCSLPFSNVVSLQDGTILDEKDVVSLSLVDAVIHHTSNLKLRPSQTKVEPTSSQSVAQGTDSDRAGEQAPKGDASSERGGGEVGRATLSGEGVSEITLIGETHFFLFFWLAAMVVKAHWL